MTKISCDTIFVSNQKIFYEFILNVYGYVLIIIQSSSLIILYYKRMVALSDIMTDIFQFSTNDKINKI